MAVIYPGDVLEIGSDPPFVGRVVRREAYMITVEALDGERRVVDIDELRAYPMVCRNYGPLPYHVLQRYEEMIRHAPLPLQPPPAPLPSGERTRSIQLD